MDGKIYAFGGMENVADEEEAEALDVMAPQLSTKAMTSCERYNAETDVWEPLPDMETARYDAAAVVFGGKIWVTGGTSRHNDYNLRSVEVFDPVTNTWDLSKNMMREDRARHMLVVLNGELHAVGGHRSEEAQGGEDEATVEKYDPDSDNWILVPDMAIPEERGGHLSAICSRG